VWLMSRNCLCERAAKWSRQLRNATLELAPCARNHFFFGVRSYPSGVRNACSRPIAAILPSSGTFPAGGPAEVKLVVALSPRLAIVFRHDLRSGPKR
jgi:hypothetical protein